MDPLLGFLCSAAVVLAIITLVGHGIWVALARLLGAAKPRIETGAAPKELWTRRLRMP